MIQQLPLDIDDPCDSQHGEHEPEYQDKEPCVLGKRHHGLTIGVEVSVPVAHEACSGHHDQQYVHGRQDRDSLVCGDE